MTSTPFLRWFIFLIYNCYFQTHTIFLKKIESPCLKVGKKEAKR